MKCKIFRSDSKRGAYLYLREDFSLKELPEDLLKLIGKYTEVMKLDLSEREKLAQVDIKLVKSDLKDKGYFLQMKQELDRQLISYG